MIGVIDRSIFEAFLDEGTRSATVTFFPNAPLTQMTLSTADILDGMTISVSVSAINSAWATMENEQGTVVGNVTDGSAKVGKRHMAYDAQF
jgi:beta-fructofuranosidase